MSRRRETGALALFFDIHTFAIPQTDRASNIGGRVRDRLDGVVRDEDFEDWFPPGGRRGPCPAVPALVSVPQFAEKPPPKSSTPP